MIYSFKPVNGISTSTVLYGFSDGTFSNPTLDTLFSRKRIKQKLVISSDNQSTFDLSYSAYQECDVFLNGMLLSEEEYTLTGQTTLTLSSSISSTLTTSDIIYVILY